MRLSGVMEGTVEMPCCLVLVFCGCGLAGACWRWLLRMDCAIHTEEENGKARKKILPAKTHGTKLNPGTCLQMRVRIAQASQGI